MGPYPIRIKCPYKKRAIWIQRHTGRMSCDDRGKDRTDAAAGQGIPGVASNHQKLERDKEVFFPAYIRGSMVLSTPDFGLLASRAGREYIPVDLSHHSVYFVVAALGH